MTNPQFIKVTFDVKRTDTKLTDGSYRIYVNDELFTQRRWIGKGFYLEELIQVLAPPGKYQIRVEPTPGTDANFKASKFLVRFGPAKVDSSGVISIVEPRA